MNQTTRKKVALAYYVTGKHVDYRRDDSVRKMWSTVIAEMFGLISKITADKSVLNHSFFLWNLNEEFMPRLIHFCRSFMTNCFADFAGMKEYNYSNMPEFSAVQILEIFFKMTFYHTSTDAIEACLDIWDDFLDQLQVMQESKVQKHDSEQYMSLLVSLFNETLKMTQFVYNHDLLNDLDNEEIDEEGETERGRFVSSNIEVIAKICQLHPIDILNALIPNFKGKHKIHPILNFAKNVVLHFVF